MEFLKSSNLLSFRNKEELSELSCISGLKDSNMLQYISDITGSCSDADLYYTLACDMSTTWVDIEMIDILSKGVDRDPIRAAFDVMNVFTGKSSGVKRAKLRARCNFLVKNVERARRREHNSSSLERATRSKRAKNSLQLALVASATDA